MISITADTKKLEFALARLADAARVGLGPIIKQEGGNIARTIMLLVPPTAKKGEYMKPRGSGLSKAAQEQGENAIKGDLFGGVQRRVGGGAKQKMQTTIGLFQRIGSSTLTPPKRNRTETASVRLGWERSKTIRIYFKHWKQAASIGDMTAFHKRYQNKKTGRVGYVSRSNIGRWQVQDQLWISNESADAYYNDLKARVGWHKAGFAAAALACGIRVPAWVRNKAGSAGTEQHNFGQNPFIIATANKVKIPNMSRYVDAAMAIRVKVTQLKINRLLSNRAVNLGFAKVDGAGKVTENLPR
jgi:hypothetical protein